MKINSSKISPLQIKIFSNRNVNDNELETKISDWLVSKSNISIENVIQTQSGNSNMLTITFLFKDNS